MRGGGGGGQLVRVDRWSIGDWILCPGELLKVSRAALHMTVFRDLSLIPMCIQAQTTSSAGQPLATDTGQKNAPDLGMLSPPRET